MILHDHGSGGKRKAWLARGKTETPAFLQSGVEPFAVSADRASGKKWDKRTVPACMIK